MINDETLQKNAASTRAFPAVNSSFIVHHSSLPFMPSSSPRLTARVLATLPQETLHAARNWSKADVRSAQWPPNSGARVIIKDLRGRSLWFRLLYGRHILRREWKVLRALSGVEGVPRVVGRPHPDVLVMQQVNGNSLAKIGAVQLEKETVARLEKLMANLHARGVTHGDLHADNILVDDAGNVFLIDWATAHLGGNRGGKVSWLAEEWRALDDRAVAKVKLAYAKKHVTETDLDTLENRSRAYRAVKSLRRGLDKMRGKKRGAADDKIAAKVKRRRALLEENASPESDISPESNALREESGALSQSTTTASTRKETS